MKSYIVQSYGYTQCPAFQTLEEARAELKIRVTEELKSAKRIAKTASKHKLGPDCYRITMGSDPQSSFWSHHSILS